MKTRKPHHTIVEAERKWGDLRPLIQKWFNDDRDDYEVIAQRFNVSTKTLERFIDKHFEERRILVPLQTITIQGSAS